MGWLDNVKKQGPYYAHGKFCDEFLNIYSNYELVITEEEEYKRLINAKNQALVNLRIKIAEGSATSAQYQRLATNYENEITNLIATIESQMIVAETVQMCKKKMNKVLRDNLHICSELGLRILSTTTNHPFDYYHKLGEELKRVKVKVETFMSNSKR